MTAQAIMYHKAFETSCMIVIVFNCYCLATADPTA